MIAMICHDRNKQINFVEISPGRLFYGKNAETFKLLGIAPEFISIFFSEDLDFGFRVFVAGQAATREG